MSMDEHMVMIHSICQQTNNVKYSINIIHVHFYLTFLIQYAICIVYNVQYYIYGLW